MMTPRALMDVIATKNRMATLRFAITASGGNGRRSHTSAAGKNIAIGAARKIHWSARPGETFSLVNSLKTSAAGCKSPRGPTRLGPYRSWMYADTLRSAIVRMAARLSTRRMTTPKESKNLMGSWLRMSRLKASPLLVPGPGDRVHEAHDGHDVRQEVSGDYLLQQLHIYRARGPVVHPVRGVRAIRDDVYCVLAARRLGPAEAFAFCRAYAAPCVPQHLALGQVLQDLLDDPDALLYLAYPHPVRSLDVARLVGDHVEVHVRVPAVRVIPAHVEAYPGTAQGRSREAHLDGLLLCQLPDTPRAGDEDLVALYEVYEVRLDALLQPLHELPDLLRYPLREVGLHAADADVMEHHPGAGDGFHDVLRALALPEGVQDGREGAELEEQEAYGGNVAHEAAQLGRQDAQGLRPRRYLDAHEVLYRHAVPVLHRHVVEVIQPVRDGNDRRVHAVLGDLLLAAVQVTHYGIAPHHGLTVELQDEPEEPVHRRVLRSHVHVYGLEPELVADVGGGEPGALPPAQTNLLGTAFFVEHLLPQSLERPLGAYLEALEQRVVVKVVLPHVEPAQVRVPPEGYPEHVVRLTLVPVGRRVDVGDRRHHGLLAFDHGLDPHPRTAQVQQLIGQLEGPVPVDDGDEREVQHAQRLARRCQHRRHRLAVHEDPHRVPLHSRLFEAVAAAQALEVALEAVLEVPLGQRHRHLRPYPSGQLAPPPIRSAGPPPPPHRHRSPWRPFRPSPSP